MQNEYRDKVFVINGGAGRVISAIPALEKYHRLNPESDFKIIVHGWESLFWSHPILQSRTLGVGQKDTFVNVYKDRDIICPEPYYLNDYYNQRISMSEAFDREINETTNHTDLTIPNLYLSTYEKASINRILKEINPDNKSKIVVVQPYGSTAQFIDGDIVDTSHRSIRCKDYINLINRISKDAVIIYFGPKEFRHPEDAVSVKLDMYNPDLRMYMALINKCDYFIGCDSVGQHMARAFNKPGSIFMGSTFEKNVTYPNHFKIFRKEGTAPVYSSIRISGPDAELADRLNDGIMNFSDDEINRYINIITCDIYN